jgi:hypothetical protein
MTCESHDDMLIMFLSDKEQEVLKSLSNQQDLTPHQVMRQSLRLYQLVYQGNHKIVPPQEQSKKCGCGLCE